MNKILTFGVFDYFHIGHLRLFEQCKKEGKAEGKAENSQTLQMLKFCSFS